MDHVDPRAGGQRPVCTTGRCDETIADTLAWHRANRDAAWRPGFRMTREREAELLALTGSGWAGSA